MTDKIVEMVDESTLTFDISPEKDGGVKKWIIKPGETDEGPLQGDKVSVHYVGTLEDGSKFDSSSDRREPFEFTLGKGEVIKAWDIGVATMKKGEVSKFICRSDYAYGTAGSPPKIPPDATLVFEVELIKWKGEDLSSKKDGGIIRRNIISGQGTQTPNEGAQMEIHLLGHYNGTVFDDRDVSFVLGEGSKKNIPYGIEKAVEKFKKGEKSLIKLSSKYGFGSRGHSELGIPPSANLEYEVELKNFEKAKEIWEMDPEEKLEQAKICKEKGTSFFKDSVFYLALKQYKRAVSLVQHDSGLSDEKKVESKEILLASHLNVSLAYLKCKDYVHARESAEEVLKLDSQNVKGIFRLGQALFGLGEAEAAMQQFRKCLDIDKDNTAAAQQIHQCYDQIKLYKEKEKKLYSGMFDKFAKADLKREQEYNNEYLSQGVGEWKGTEDTGNSNDVDVEVDNDSEDGNIEVLEEN